MSYFHDRKKVEENFIKLSQNQSNLDWFFLNDLKKVHIILAVKT